LPRGKEVAGGKPTDKQRRVFDIVLKAQRAAHKAIRPGVTCESIDRIAREIIENSGYGPGYKYFAHRLGHGIGMDGHEYPYLVKGNQLKLEPGMTFSNEPGIYIYGAFGVRVEDCFAVTQEGAQFLGGMLSTSIENPFGECPDIIIEYGPKGVIFATVLYYQTDEKRNRLNFAYAYLNRIGFAVFVDSNDLAKSKNIYRDLKSITEEKLKLWK